MEVWKIIFLSKWVICRFQPLIFQGAPVVPYPQGNDCNISLHFYGKLGKSSTQSAEMVGDMLVTRRDILRIPGCICCILMRMGIERSRIHKLLILPCLQCFQGECGFCTFERT